MGEEESETEISETANLNPNPEDEPEEVDEADGWTKQKNQRNERIGGKW